MNSRAVRFIARLRMSVIIRLVGVVISTRLINRCVWNDFPWIVLLNRLSCNILLLTLVFLLSIYNYGLLLFRLLLKQDGVWFDKFWTLQVVMNVPILVNDNFDILVTSPNELRGFHEYLDAFRVQFLNLVVAEELLFFLLGYDWEIIFTGFIKLLILQGCRRFVFSNENIKLLIFDFFNVVIHT